MTCKNTAIRLIGALLGAAVFLSGCGGASAPVPDTAGPFAIRLYDDVGSFDPALTNSGPGYQLSMFLYDRLVVVSGGQVKSYLATSWKVAAKRVVFTIKDGVTCADGTKLTPTAIAGSLTRALAPTTKSPIAPSLFEGGATFKADDQAGTVTAETGKPNPALLLTFANPVLSIVCPAGVEDPKRLSKASAGSGPYVLSKAVTGSEYTLERRKGYAWTPETTAGNVSSLPDVVVAKVLQNETTAANVFLQGQLNITNSSNEDAVSRIRARGFAEKRSPNALGFLLFNQAQGPGADPAVRKAIAQAVDPAAYAAAAQGKLATPSANLLPAETTICAQTDGAAYRPEVDLAAARKTLEADGWTKGPDGIYQKSGKQLVLRVGSHNQEGSAGDYLTQTLIDLGAKAQGKQVELPAYIETVRKGDWDVYAATLAVGDSPATLAPLIFGPGALDLGHIRNVTFEREMTAAGVAPDFKSTCGHWRAAQDALVKNLDVVPRAHYNNIYFGNHASYQFGFAALIEPTSIKRD
ncbi:ABC transporter substrate-binding protein [Kribbella sp. NPDC049227]|uniref:ABC transporter substrate-binding protein n=1 Tax=Kribbella sp. NPDC049227 TaxID=3364113 RepID=UPI0037174D5E